MNRLAAATDLASMFGIEMEPSASVSDLMDTSATADYLDGLCRKCKGKGKFIGYSGRVVGNCFACNGTGLAAAPPAGVKDGDCVKCAGSGEWRPGRPCFACDGAGKAASSKTAAIDVGQIATAFAAARAAGKKSPRLRLDTFVFSGAPMSGKNPGAIYVKENEEYLGKVVGTEFLPTRACDDPTRARIVAVAADPHAAAVAYGRRTSNCSCCGLELTNEESIRLGIGPICRGKFGWGG